ncbi:MAG TPA: hypothetical protein VNJ04_07215 [Gemmatimonadaceae bacterium]|nr:hypothetical protein [Gemmatimonadaceae bacterium]
MEAGFIEFVLKLRDQLSSQLAGVEQKLSSFGSTALAGGAALTAGLTVPLVAVGASVIQLGMDAVESENLVGVSFGNMAGAAKDWAANLSESLGINRFESEKTAATLFTMTSNMGLSRDASFAMSTGVVQLAADMASFRNIGMDEALEKIRSGLVGESEPLKALGILVDDATIKAYAYASGIAKQGEELSASEKVTARYGAILQQTSNDQGDLARTLESPANQLRIMRERVSEAATELGVTLIPILTNVVGVVGQLVPYLQGAVEWFSELPGPVKTGAVVVLALVAALGPLLLIIGAVATGVAALLPLLPMLGAAFAVLTGPIGLVVAAIGVLTAVWLTWGDDIIAIVKRAYEGVKHWLVDLWEGSIFQSVARMLQAIIMLFVALHVRVAEEAAKIFTAVKTWLLDKLQPVFDALRPIVDGIATAWGLAKAAIETIVSGIYTVVKTYLVDKFAAIVDAIKRKVDAVTGFFENMYDKVVGNSYVPDMVDGIAAQFGRLPSVMVEPARQATREVREAFKGLLDGAIGAFEGGGLAGLGSFLTREASTIAKDFLSEIMSWIPGVGPILSKFAGPIVDGVKKLFGGIFAGSDGRDMVKQFAASLGGFDALHVKLNALGAEGERLWIALTQGVGRDNPQQARAAILAIQDALAGVAQTVTDVAVPALVTLGNTRIPKIRIPYGYEQEGDGPVFPDMPDFSGFGPSLPGFTGGTNGYQNFGSGTPVMLHGWEKVTPLGRSGSAGGGISVQINNPVVREQQDIDRLADEMIRRLVERGV